MKPASRQPAAKAADPQALQAVGVCIFLVLAVWAVFGQTAHFQFIDYDDPANVYSNPVVRQGLSANSVGWAFTHVQVANWIPLTTLSHMLDCQLFGLNAGGHHLVSVLFHAATAVLLFLVLRQMTGSLWRAAFVAAVFAVHPLRAESVAWVTERKDVLSAFFFVLAIGAYIRQVRRPSRAGYVAVFLLFALGLLAKSMVATLPFVLLLLDYWPLGRFHNAREFLRLAREKIPLLALSAGSCVATALVPGLVTSSSSYFPPPPLLARIGNAIVACVVYLEKLVFPSGLATPYATVHYRQPLATVCLAFILVAAISMGAIMWRKKRPYLLTGWLWYLGMLFPVAGIIQLATHVTHADRYTYLPGIGLTIAVTWAVADWSAGWQHRRVILAGLMTAAIGALTVCGHIQTSYWKDDATLWTRTLACTTDNFVALNNMGTYLVQQGKLDNAIADFQKSLDIAPENAEAINNLGNTLFVKGADQAAIAQYQKALQIQPDNSRAENNLGKVLLKLGRVDEAIAHYRKSVQLNPDEEGTRVNLGQALLKKGDFAGAMACLDKAAAASVNPLGSWTTLGNDSLQQGNWQAAILCYQRALEINPRSTDLRASQAGAFVNNGQIKEAIGCLEKALEVNPDHVPVLNNLALLLGTTPDPSLRDGAKAVALATRASQLSGDRNPAVLHSLATVYAEEGSYGMAVATARRALELAVEQKQDALAAALRAQLKSYEAKAPPPDAAQGAGDLK